MKKSFFALIFTSVVILEGCFATSTAKTRWSSIHSFPDADLIDDNDVVLDFNTFYFSDSIKGGKFKPGGTVTYSLIKWVNLNFGYAGGLNLGLKARVLGETDKYQWIPSLAIGIDNCVNSQPAYYYDKSSDSSAYTNELYVALAKSIEPIRLRIHLGFQTIPHNKRERFDPYVGLEKYFGGGVYTTIEVQRCDHTVVPSIFASWRFWKSRVELSAGAISLVQLFTNKDHSYDPGITSSANEGFVRPGIYFGLRFHGNLGKLGKSSGFMSVEDKISEQQLEIKSMRKDIDSLRNALIGGNKQIKTIDSSISAIKDSTLKSKEHYRNIAIEKLNSLRVYYSQEPFEPELVKNGYNDIVGYRDEIVPALFDIVFDISLDKKIRTLAVSVLGEIGTGKALDALIDILSQSKENDVKIESLIALGKNKETRATYLMRQLANDPDDALAFTASEVLKKLELQTGVKPAVRDTVMQLPTSIPEKKIEEKNNSSENTGKIEKKNVQSSINTSEAKKTSQADSSKVSGATVKVQKTISLTNDSTKLTDKQKTK